VRFCILRDALRWSAPQDEVHYSKDLPHPEEAPIETPPAAAPQDRRAVSKGFETGSRIFPVARYSFLSVAVAFVLSALAGLLRVSA